jgi:hypothetical protein
MARVLLLLCSAPFASVSLAHHSVSALYDYDNIGELEGTVKSLAWINPHIHLTIERIAENGEPELWRLEGSAVNLLQRRGIGSDILDVGDRVIVAGPLSSRGQQTMIASLVTVPNGDKVALFPGSAVRAGLLDPDAPAARSSQGEARAAAPTDEGGGIFGVWRPIAKPNTDSGSGIPPWSLTDAALAAYQAFDPLTDDPALSCVQAGMPVILDTPYPVEFAESGDDILIRIEEWDGRRTIHMNAAEGGEAELASPMGYSVGRWEGNTLIITPNNLRYPYFDDLGTPQRGALEINERYTLSADGNRLDWEATATDPEIFTESPVLKGYRAWSPR